MYVGPPNAVAGLAGAFTYTVTDAYLPEWWVVVAAIAVTLGVRLMGPLFHVTIPQPRRAAHQLKKKRETERRERERSLRRPRHRGKTQDRNHEPPSFD